MNGDEFHEIQKTALLADTKTCYDLIWLYINARTQAELQEKERMHSAGEPSIGNICEGSAVIIIIIKTTLSKLL